MERPDWFGQRTDADWAPATGQLMERGERAAAYYQHIAASQARRILDEQRTSVTHFATQLGITADTLRRKLRGERVATLNEILAWAIALGIDILPVPNSLDELEP